MASAVTEGNRYKLPRTDGTFDLKQLAGDFDITKASDWQGATLNGTVLRYNPETPFITYKYNITDSKTETFTLLPFDGKRKQGWRNEKTMVRYYIDGKYLVGLHKINRTTYYFDELGERRKGWRVINANQHYFNLKNGGRLTGKRRIGKTVFLLSDRGIEVGWQSLGGRQYYFDPKHSGGMITGKRKIGKTTYLFHTKGYKIFGWHNLGGKKYYFDPRYGGGMITGLRQVGKGTYYFRVKDSAPGAGDKGSAVTNGSVRIGNRIHYFNESGLRYKVKTVKP